MDLIEIQNAIYRLESGDTTFENCEKLANLYTIVNNFPQDDDDSDDVVEEYNDILPSYDAYCEAKREYQMGSHNDIDVIQAKMQILCKEIKEFLCTLYSGTDSESERKAILNMINDFLNTVNT